MPEWLAAARQRDVDFLLCEALFQRTCLKLLIFLGDQRLNLRLRLVDDLADLRAVFLRDGTHAAQNTRELTFLAQELHADVVQLAERRGRIPDCLCCLCLQGFNLLFHGH